MYHIKTFMDRVYSVYFVLIVETKSHLHIEGHFHFMIVIFHLPIFFIKFRKSFMKLPVLSLKFEQLLLHSFVGVINHFLSLLYLIQKPLLFLLHISLQFPDDGLKISLAAVLQKNGINFPDRFHCMLIWYQFLNSAVESHTMSKKCFIKFLNIIKIDPSC